LLVVSFKFGFLTPVIGGVGYSGWLCLFLWPSNWLVSPRRGRGSRRACEKIVGQVCTAYFQVIWQVENLPYGNFFTASDGAPGSVGLDLSVICLTNSGRQPNY
jgi:hypothetical protein